ncbi:enoyl-CoA hydratase/isomerase family protein [Nocardia sp. NPDC005745]|uniref:enoyl-CoA hydratase/isomerase family protein n=1 Tax=Nocardia sp. NPDC005745 TaxID=3157061 RepID=UPI0033FCE735
MTHEHLVVEDLGGGVWKLGLDRPDARNALSSSLRVAVSDAVDRLCGRDDVGALVLSGAGSVFCAGFDMAEFGRAAEDPDFGVELWASSDRFHHTLLRCPVPLIAALNGPALAGGFDLATMCDLRIAQPGVWFARPEVAFAVPLYEPLRDLVGGALARELCLTGRRVELDEALRIGLVNRVAPETGALEAAIELAREIAARPREAIRATKAKFVTAAGVAGRATLAL